MFFKERKAWAFTLGHIPAIAFISSLRYEDVGSIRAGGVILFLLS